MFLVKALRWGDLGAHSYIVGLYSTLELAISNADEEVLNRGGKYDCVVYQIEVDSHERKNVYYKFSVLKETKPTHNYYDKRAEPKSLEEFTKQYKQFVDWNTPIEDTLRHLHSLAFYAGQQIEVTRDIEKDL